MIYDAKSVKAACNGVLSAAFNQEVPIYGNDTLDGYRRPSFFTEILPSAREKTGRYVTRQGYIFKITYFEETHDEAHCLDIYAGICAAFEPTVRLKNRKKLVVEDTELDWTGENADMLQVTITFYSTTEIGGYTDDSDLMEEVELEMESEVY